MVAAAVFAGHRLKRHPLSMIFGPMAPDVRKDFEEGIMKYVDPDGLRIYTYEGMVLDGWWRYNTFLDHGIEPILIPYEHNDPVGFAFAHNANRRHLDAGQRVMSMMDAYSWRKAQRNGEKSEVEAESEAMDSLGLSEAADVSRQTARQALKAEKGGVGDFVRRGELPVRAAAAIVGHHEDILEKLKRGEMDAEQAKEKLKERKAPSRSDNLEAELGIVSRELNEQKDKVDELQVEVDFLRKASEGDSAAEDVGNTFNSQQEMIRGLRGIVRMWMSDFGEMAAERDYWRERAKRAEQRAGGALADGPEPDSDWDGSGRKMMTAEYIEAVDDFLDRGGPVPSMDVKAVMAARGGGSATPDAHDAPPEPVTSAQADWNNWDDEGPSDAWLYNVDRQERDEVEDVVDGEGADPIRVEDEAPVGSLTWDDPEELALSELEDEEDYWGDDVEEDDEDAHDARAQRPYSRRTCARSVERLGYGVQSVPDGGVMGAEGRHGPPNVLDGGGAVV
ncbi:MAG: hypothetical protein F4X94_09865 [Dehalococcoidia bacterium]|nr:hypothetical protein [Dehalococcoidia bacterium]